MKGFVLLAVTAFVITVAGAASAQPRQAEADTAAAVHAWKFGKPLI